MTETRSEVTGREKGNPHIDKEMFCDWLAGEMDPHREQEFLGHIGKCTFCAQQFAGWMELPHEPPRYLKEEISQRAHQMDVQVSVQVKEKTRQIQLFIYSLKVGLAVMTSIFLLMLTANIRDVDSGAVREWKLERMQQQDAEEQMSITDTLNQKSGEISSFLNEISNGLFRMSTEDREQIKNQEVTR